MSGQASRQVPRPVPADGWNVPVRAAFAGFRGLPLLAIAHSNATARLVLFQDRVECRVLRSATRPFAEIEQIDIVQSFRTQNLRIIWRNERLTFVANLGREDLLRDVAAFFSEMGVALSERAQKLVEGRPRGGAEDGRPAANG